MRGRRLPTSKPRTLFRAYSVWRNHLKAFTRSTFFAVAALALAALAGPASAGPKTKIDTPLINCAGSGKDYIDISVCAPGGTGATGAPTGFTIQWMTKADYDLNGSTFDGASGNLLLTSYCDASFSGNANLSRYNLAPGGCVTVRIGELLLDSGASTSCPNGLLCGTTYVFRAFSHGTSTLNRSSFTGILACSTASCDGVCDPAVKSFGFWKNQYPVAWPSDVLVNGMTVGGHFYTADQLESILLATPAGGNALVALAHQVISARLSILNGASQAYIDATAANLAMAETLMATTGAVPPVGTGSLTGAQASALTTALDATRATFECE